MRFPGRADILPQIPEPERQQMPAEEPTLPNPPRRSGRIRQPVILPDNVYGNHAPADILGNDSDDVFSEPSRRPRPGPSMAQKTELGTSSDLTQKSDITAKMVQEGGAELFNLLLKKAAVPVRSLLGDRLCWVYDPPVRLYNGLSISDLHLLYALLTYRSLSPTHTRSSRTLPLISSS